MLVAAPASPRFPEATVSGPTRDDHELIRACLEGSQEAFAALVKRHEERAFWAAYRVVGNADAARDVAQEAFVRVWRALDRFDFSMAFTTWLYRITVNLAIDHLRRNKRHKGMDIEVMQEVLADEAEDLAPDHRRTQGELAHRVRSVLQTLGEKYRTVLALRDLEGLSSKQISDISGISHATVRWRLHVARKQFREAWERLESRLEKARRTRAEPCSTETGPETPTRNAPPA
jgi:RNA polymerase sigma-70 factor (ECF subfamily)